MPKQTFQSSGSNPLSRFSNFMQTKRRTVSFAIFGIFIAGVASVGVYLTFFSHADTQATVNGRILAYAPGTGVQDPISGTKLVDLKLTTSPVATTAQKISWSSGSVQAGSAISPDGERIAQVEQTATGGTELVTRRLMDGGDRKSLFTATGVTDIKWSPDGTKLAITMFLNVPADSPQANSSNIFIVTLATRNLTALTSATTKGEQYRLLEYLKDGRVVYTYSNPALAGTDIYAMSDTGTSKTLQQHQPADVHHISVSRTTAKIAYNTFAANAKTYGLVTMNLDGSNKKIYTNFPIENVGGPGITIWSPDEKYIVTDNEVINAATGTTVTTLAGYNIFYGWQALPAVTSGIFSAQGNTLEVPTGTALIADSTNPAGPVVRVTASGYTSIANPAYFQSFLNKNAGWPARVCVTARDPIPTQPANITITNLAGIPQTFTMEPGGAYKTFCNIQTVSSPSYTQTYSVPRVTVGTAAYVLVSSISVRTDTTRWPSIWLPNNSAVVIEAYNANFGLNTTSVSKTTDTAIKAADKTVWQISPVGASGIAGARIKFNATLNYYADMPKFKICVFARSTDPTTTVQFSDTGLSGTSPQGWGSVSVKQKFTEYGYTAYCQDKGVGNNIVNKVVPIQVDAYNNTGGTAPLYIDKVTLQYFKD